MIYYLAVNQWRSWPTSVKWLAALSAACILSSLIILGIASNYRLTQRQTALGVPVGVIVAGSLAFIATRRTARENYDLQIKANETQLDVTRLTLESQRQLARDERLWQTRSNIYLEAISTVAKLGSNVPDGDDAGGYTEEELDNLNKLLSAFKKSISGLELYGTSEVRDQMNAVLHAANDLFDAPKSTSPPPNFGQLEIDFLQAVVGLMQALRDDLHEQG